MAAVFTAAAGIIDWKSQSCRSIVFTAFDSKQDLGEWINPAKVELRKRKVVS
jgi:hypothetical protein